MADQDMDLLADPGQLGPERRELAGLFEDQSMECAAAGPHLEVLGPQRPESRVPTPSQLAKTPLRRYLDETPACPPR
jgi:hypothetical protein